MGQEQSVEGGPVAEGGATAGDGRQTTGGSAASGDPYDSIGNLGLAANHPNLKYKPFEYAEGERHTKYKKTAEEEEAERAALAAAEAARRALEEAEADSAARKAAAAADGDGAAEEAEESGFEATEAVFDGSTGGNPLPPKDNGDRTEEGSDGVEDRRGDLHAVVEDERSSASPPEGDAAPRPRHPLDSAHLPPQDIASPVVHTIPSISAALAYGDDDDDDDGHVGTSAAGGARGDDLDGLDVRRVANSDDVGEDSGGGDGGDGGGGGGGSNSPSTPPVAIARPSKSTVSHSLGDGLDDDSGLEYAGLSPSLRSPGEHLAGYGTQQFYYYGDDSEGNRYISNDQL